MTSLVVKRSIVVAGHKTSVTLEDAFWNGLKEIASGRNITLSDLVTAVDNSKRRQGLSSAIRLFVFDFYRNQLADIKDGRDDAERHFAMNPRTPSAFGAPGEPKCEYPTAGCTDMANLTRAKDAALSLADRESRQEAREAAVG